MLAILLLAIVACTKEQEPTYNPSNGGGSGGGNSISGPQPPTGVRATREGSMVKVSWNSVSNAYCYKLYRASAGTGGTVSSNGPYTWIYSTTVNYCYDESPDHMNFYRVTTIDWNYTESEMSSYTYCGFGKDNGSNTTAPDAPQVRYSM